MQYKRLFVILVLLSILTFTVGSAFKSPAITQIQLLSVSFKEEKGVTFKFLVVGDIRRNDLKGNVLVGSKSLKLYCNYSGDLSPAVVTCTSAKGTVKLAGRYGVVYIARHTFGFTVPARLPG